MSFYTLSQGAVAASTSTDSKTIRSTASGAGSVLRVHELFMGGQDGSNSVLTIRINRPSTAASGTAPSTQTPRPIDPASAAAAFTAYGTYGGTANWQTAATLHTDDLLTAGFNAFGGVWRWVAPPEAYLVIGGTGATSDVDVRSGSGTGTYTAHYLIEQR